MECGVPLKWMVDVNSGQVDQMTVCPFYVDVAWAEYSWWWYQVYVKYVFLLSLAFPELITVTPVYVCMCLCVCLLATDLLENCIRWICQ